MARWVYLLAAFVALAAWAGAQGPVPPAPLSAEDKLRLLKTNGTLIDELVRDGVEMSKAGQPVDRAVKCREASQALVNAIQQAATTEDAERVAVLMGLYRELVRDGLMPTIEEAKVGIPPNSPADLKLRGVREKYATNVSELRTHATSTGKLANNPRVKEALKQLDELNEQLKK
jgi:hypothetical protein